MRHKYIWTLNLCLRSFLFFRFLLEFLGLLAIESVIRLIIIQYTNNIDSHPFAGQRADSD